MTNEAKLSVTLWPSFPHFVRFALDQRVSMVRLNSAMMSHSELDEELKLVKMFRDRHGMPTPLYFDVKGRQLRISEVFPNLEYLDVRLNHPIKVNTPTPVLFKAGADVALLKEISEDGYRLKFDGGPKYKVKAGESLHIRDTSLVVGGNQFTTTELEKIQKVVGAGFKHFFLSYVESQKDVDEFVNLVGSDSIVNLKIENKNGVRYVQDEFVKKPNLNLVLARGDMYVELNRPHEILSITKLLVSKDPQAIVGSRLLLSTIADPVPSCADFSELAWLYDIGYRNMMLCDELCLDGKLLGRAVTVFDAFRKTYIPITEKKSEAQVIAELPVTAKPVEVKRKSWWRLSEK